MDQLNQIELTSNELAPNRRRPMTEHRRTMLIEKGYTIIKQQESIVALEYESDSIEYYKMLSNEFNYDKVKETAAFAIK